MSFITYKNMRVRYEYCPCPRQNAGNVVLLHSLGLSMEEYDPFMRHILPTFNVLRFDMLGHGQSGRPSEPVSVNMLADQLKDMTRQFFTGKFYIFAGPAMGYVAARFCRVYDPPVSGLVLISPQPIFLSLEEKQQLNRQIETIASNGFHVYKQFLLSHFTVNQHPSLVGHLTKQLDQTSELVHLGLINDSLHGEQGVDFQNIHIPILALAGTQDTLFPTSMYGITANYMKAELIMIPSAAHLVAVDNPEASADAILGFIAAIESGKPTEMGFVLGKEATADALYKGFNQAEKEAHPALNVYLLHTFYVQIGEVDVTKGWNVRKVKSLFLYLLFHGTVTREELIDVFWKDVPLKNARNQLRINLHYLRLLLNQGGFEFFLTDREHVFLKKNIQCDAAAYIDNLKEAYTLMLSGDLNIHTARSILDISPRKLLTHVYDEWYLHFREEIEAKYTELCQWTAARLNVSHHRDEAAKYTRLIEELWE